MAKKVEKILTQEQKEDIVLFVHNMVREGNSLTYTRERHLESENDDYKCSITTSLFGDNKEMIVIYVNNKVTKKTINLTLHDMDKTPVSAQLKYLQNKVDDIIDQNTPTFYSDDEIEDVIGDPSLLARRSKKVDHLVDNIVEKKKRRFRFGK